MSNVYGCDSCGALACSMAGRPGPGCNGWVASGSEVPLLHSITLPPAPRSIVLSANIGTACNQIHELYGDDLDRIALGLDWGVVQPPSPLHMARIITMRGSSAWLPTYWDRTETPAAARDHARWGCPPLPAQQGETDAPGTPRPADCTCSSFNRCEPCRIAKALAEGKRYAIRWHQPDGRTGIGDAFATREECQGCIDRGIDRINGRVTLIWYSVVDLTRCPGCNAPEGCNCIAGCPHMAARIAAAGPLQSMRIRTADCYCGPHIMCVPCKKLEVAAAVDPLDVEYDGVKLRDLVVMDGVRQGLDAEYVAQFTPAQRAAVSAHWSAQLRAKVDAAKQAERNVVTYCELDPDD